jgi:hypothetical protein
MLQGMADRIAETALAAPDGNPRAKAFGYLCGRCMRCCYHKGIQVNPYEVARLARRLGQTTTEFCATWTRDGAGAPGRLALYQSCSSPRTIARVDFSRDWRGDLNSVEETTEVSQ